MAMILHAPCPTCSGPAALAICPTHGKPVPLFDVGMLTTGAALMAWNPDAIEKLRPYELVALRESLAVLGRFVGLQLDLENTRADLERMRPRAQAGPPWAT